MSDDNKDELAQVFLAETILPDSSGFFEDEPKTIEAAIQDANIILDTNVLLIPYGAGANSLTQISTVYSDIKKRDRLFIPGQVAREFVKNRPVKLAELHKGISDKISRLTLPEKLSYPILESVAEFKELNDSIVKLEELKSEVKSVAKRVCNTIKDWGWNDPVSQAYRPIFTKEIIITPEYDQEKILKEMQIRYKRAIPPGYKDASKPDSGIGDFLIWKTILHLGTEHNRSVVFVSGDEKADWFHGSEGNGFLPRYELQAEYRRISGGYDLYIIPLSKLLELQKAEENSVKEIRIEEKRIKEAATVICECPECNVSGEYELSVSIGTSALPACTACGSKFHLHRTPDGALTHKYKGLTLSKNFPRHSPEKVVEVVECPYCEEENIKELGISPHSTGWCVCDGCGHKFPIHRKGDGSVMVKTTTNG